MKRHLVALGALVALVLLAGCLGGGGGGDVGPETFNASSLEDHRQILEEAGSYTVEVSTDQSTVTVNQTYAVDLEADRMLQRVDSVGVEQVTWITPSGSYTRASNAEGKTQFQSGGAPEEAPGERDFASVLPGDIEFVRTGTTTVDGTRVAVFEDVFSEDVGPSRTPSGYRSENFSVTVYVRDDGLLKGGTFTKESGRVTIRTRLTFSEVGSTSVEEPSWLDEARAAVEN